MSLGDPVEVTTRYATTVETLAEAWQFVMARIDLVGPDPSIEIKAYWRISVHDMGREEDRPPPRYFSAVVSGMTQEQSQ